MTDKEHLLYAVEKLCGHVAGKLIVWTGKLAARRGDQHEVTHCYMALVAGNSEDCGENGEDCTVTLEMESEAPNAVNSTFIYGDVTNLDTDRWFN